jgi:cell division inhibitor SepF
MGMFNKMKGILGIHPEDYDDEDYEDMITKREDTSKLISDLDGSSYNKKNKVVNIHATTQLQVVLVKPDSFEAAREIADHLNDKKTVVLNLESANKEVARRLIDFLCGVSYANSGKIQRVASSTFIITPYNVDMIGDLLGELENNGLFT